MYRGTRHRSQAAEELATDGRLFAFQLAEVSNTRLPWLARPVRAAPRVLELAMGRLRLDIDVARFATLIPEPPTGDALLVAPATRSLVTEAVRRQREVPGIAAIPIIVGPGGAGRSSLALAAARAEDLPVLLVRARDLPREPDALARALRGAGREAILFGAMLVVRDLEALAGDTERNIADLVPLAASILSSHAGPLALPSSALGCGTAAGG